MPGFALAIFFSRSSSHSPSALRVDVTNIGKRAGDALPQLYVHHLGSKVERPALKLAGFQRVHLAPSETKTVAMTLDAKQLAYWKVKQQRFVVEREPVRLMVGDSSENLKLNTTVQVR